MSDKTSESENRKPGRPRKYSTTEEANSGGSSSSGTPLKKGPWTSSEDAILVDYVTKHGEGNWNAVQKNTGLARCGKSCRLRWANHLRPDLKKGAFTPEEEERILELHLKYGNKWARMAAELPGRTDNEIKNYWNTRIKRLQRLGQPLYPPELHIEANENRENWDTGTSGNVETCPSNTSQTNTLEIPEVRFKYFEPNQHFLSCPPPPLPDMPCSSLLVPSRFPNNFSFPATSHPNVNPQEYDNPFRTYQYDNDPVGTLGHPQSLWSPSTWDPDLNINYPSVIDVPGSHAGKNGTSSSMKMELPSLQYSAASQGGGSWATSGCSPNASLESADPYIQSLLSEQTQSNFRSLGDCLMLDEMLLEHANAMAGRSRWEDRGSSHTQSAASAFVDNTPFSASPGDEPQSAETVLGNIAEPETLDEILRHFYSHASAVTNRTKREDLGSPLTHTPVSAFVNNTPFRASHGDEPQHTEHVPGNIANPYMAGWVSPEFDGQKDVMSQPENVRPDLLLDSLWFDTTTTNWRATGNRSTRW